MVQDIIDEDMGIEIEGMDLLMRTLQRPMLGEADSQSNLTFNTQFQAGNPQEHVAPAAGSGDAGTGNGSGAAV